MTLNESAVLSIVFGCLSDPTRRDILRRVADQELSIGEIAKTYHLTFAAVSKHLGVLEKASLITKRRQGKRYLVHLSPKSFKEASEYLNFYRRFWENKLDALRDYLNSRE